MKTKYTYTTTLSNGLREIFLMLLALIVIPANAKNTDPILQKRLENLSQQLEKKRQQFHIPGMAIAIVKDDKVIFSKGFGVSDLENNTPVTAKTIFSIGSTTKAFTATLIAQLVDKGTMQWDDPITKHLPYLQFKMNNEAEQITIRDMLSHRTGFTRFNLLYANGKVSREEMLHAAIKAEPWADFRQKFLYTNLMIVGAGVAAAKSEGSNWDSLLEQGLLKPLGMKNTTSRYKKVQRNKRLSKGYMWLSEQNKHKQLQMHDITNIGPAGAINSNINDMSKWLMLQIGNGKYKGKRLISEQQILETRSPQIKISADASYGLGWMLREYKGQKMVAHDGSVEGYSAIVAFLPESKIGYVLLTNLTTTGLLAESMNMVWDTLLPETKPEIPMTARTVNDSESYEMYLGDYIANFGSFVDTPFTFHVLDGTPYVNVPGQMDYELKAADKDGKMYFAVTDTVAISFDKNAQGAVAAMRMYQGGMKFEIPKKGTPIEPEINLDELQKFIGSYPSELFNGNLKVLIQNNRLALDVPNQMVFELHTPDENGHRKFRIKSVMSAVFETNNDNQVTAISIYKSDKKQGTAERTSKVANELPSLEDIMKLRQTEKRKKALKTGGGFRLTGKVSMAQSGVTGTVVQSFIGYDRYREEIDLGKYGSITTGLNPNAAAMDISFASFRELHGKYLEQLQKMHPASMIDWQHFYSKIKVQGVSEIEYRKVYIIKLSGGEIPALKLFIDAESGDVIQAKSKMLEPTMGSIPVSVRFENYKEIDGLRLPFKVTVRNKFNGKSTIEWQTLETNLTFNPEIFTLNNSNKGDDYVK